MNECFIVKDELLLKALIDLCQIKSNNIKYYFIIKYLKIDILE